MYLTLFGTPSGFTARTYGRPPFEVDDRWIDVRHEVPLDDAEWAVVVSRRQSAQGLLTWIGLYRPAHEIHVSRGGQYGAGLWVLNQAAPGPEAFALLTAVADEVARLALANGKFTRGFDAFEPEIRWPDSQGAAVRKALRPITQAGLGWGDKPMLLMDASAPDDTAACGLLIDVAQGGAGLGGFQRMVIADLPRVVRQIRTTSRATTTTPARWQQEAEAIADAGTRRLQGELRAALDAADAARKDLAAVQERLAAEHRLAIESQAAELTAAFNRQLQQAYARIGELEPALQKAQGELEAAILEAQSSEAARLQVTQLLQELQADADASFQASHGARLSELTGELQFLQAQLANSRSLLADAQKKRDELEHNNQSLRSNWKESNRQRDEDAARHAQELANLRNSHAAQLEEKLSALRSGQDQLETANNRISDLQQRCVLLGRTVDNLQSDPAPQRALALHPADASHDAFAPETPRRRLIRRAWPSGVSPRAALVAGLGLVIFAFVAVSFLGSQGAPQTQAPASVSSGVVEPASPDCSFGWQSGADGGGPPITVSPNEPRAPIAQAIWTAACRASRAPACEAYDLREIERQLDAVAPAPGVARWTFRASLPPGCRLAADSTWEWTAGKLLPQRVYVDQPASAKKTPPGAATGADKSDKPVKVMSGKAEPPKGTDTRPGAAGAAASAHVTQGNGNRAGVAGAHVEARPAPAGDKPAPAGAVGGSVDQGP